MADKKADQSNNDDELDELLDSELKIKIHDVQTYSGFIASRSNHDPNWSNKILLIN